MRGVRYSYNKDICILQFITKGVHAMVQKHAVFLMCKSDSPMPPIDEDPEEGSGGDD